MNATTSTVTGWSSFTTSVITYMLFDKVVSYKFNLAGTSNNATTTPPLPFTSSSSAGNTSYFWTVSADNGTTSAVGGRGIIGISSTTVTLQNSPDGAAYTNSGSKTVINTATQYRID